MSGSARAKDRDPSDGSKAAEGVTTPRPSGGAETGSSATTREEPADPADASRPVESGAAESTPPGAKRDLALRARRREMMRGAAICALGTGATFLMMSNAEQLPNGQLFGIVAMLVATAGLLDALGLFRRAPNARPLARTMFGQLEDEPFWMSPGVTVPVSLAVLVLGIIVGGYEQLPYTIACALLALVPSVFRRPGLLVFVVVSGFYLPMLGAYGLWDPWETHYGEVAREILSRDDWISLFWAQENWFWSKPILIFWSEALSLGALGVEYLPDANPSHPEWAIRLPHFIMAMGALLATYGAVRRVFNARAGVLAALVLSTMPHFFFLAHQAITDIPFVANMTIAMALLVIAITQDPDAEVRTYRLLGVSVSARHAVLGGLSLVILPQILYLASRNVTMYEGFKFAWHRDTFAFGSAGNTGVPGNAPVHDVVPWDNSLMAQPGMQALYYLVGFALLIFLLRKERRVQALSMVGFYLFAGLAFLGKGIPGFALPGMVALFYLIASRRWSLLFEGRLRIAIGILTVCLVGLPWYVTMYIRHGPAFTDRLLVHDHINRLASGVHGDTGSIQYFIEQLGYATFPWAGLVPAAVVAWFFYDRASTSAAADPVDPAHVRRREAILLLGLWFFAAFTLFSAMITKFHHYIFPAVPPAGILTGLLLDRMFGRTAVSRRTIIATVFAALGGLVLVLGVAGQWGDIRGVIPEGVKPSSDWVFAQVEQATLFRVVVAFGLGLLIAAAALFRDEPLPSWASPKMKATAIAAVLGLVLALFGGVIAVMGALAVAVAITLLGRTMNDSLYDPDEARRLSAVAAAAAVIVGLVGRDLSWETAARPQGYERLIHLFVYNYGRAWPEQFDYRPILTGFAIVATGLILAAMLAWVRPVVMRAFLGVAIAFAAWTLNVYMVDLSPHWGQRELVKKYYDERASSEQPLVAWQMNWKGENFYTGNRVSVFVDLDNKKVREWIAENKGLTAFFVLEHSRLGGFRSLLPGREIEEVTDTRFNNKFILVKATL